MHTQEFLNKHGVEGYSGHGVTTQTSPQGKLRIRIFVPVEWVLGISEFLLNLKDTLTGIYKRVFSNSVFGIREFCKREMHEREIGERDTTSPVWNRKEIEERV